MSTPKLIGKLNYYTVEVGDGRDIELSIVDSHFCWRRVGDVEWIKLFSISDITPEKGVDYLTHEDIISIKSLLKSELCHSDMTGCDEPDQHPISSITGLESTLSNISKNYTHKQSTASDTWHIVHNLNKYPSITIVDSAGTTVAGEIIYLDMDRVDIKFTGPFSGKAYLN